VDNKRFRFLPVLVIAALVLAAFTPGLAYAQGEQPQEPPAVSEGSEAPDDAPPAEPSGEETPPVEEAPPVEQPAVEPPLEEQPTEEAPLNDGVETLNEEGAVLVDGNGQPVPLASELAAEALTGTDVYFSCGTDDQDGTNDNKCHYGSIGDAINDFADRSGTGNIFIGSGQFDEDVEALNIGNLTGFEGQGSASTQINGRLTATSLINFLLQGFTVYGDARVYTDGDLSVQDVHVTAGQGETDGSGALVAGAFGSVYMDDVQVTEGAGAVVCGGTNNCLGITDSTPGAERETSEEPGIVIKNSTFSQNNAGAVSMLIPGGLAVQAFGNVTLDNVTMQNNEGGGLFVMSYGSEVQLSDVTSTGNGWGMMGSNVIMTFSVSPDAQADTSSILPGGFLTISDSTFSHNSGGIGLLAVAGQGISITDSHFDYNYLLATSPLDSSSSEMAVGLVAAAPFITLNGVTANHNGGVGAALGSDGMPLDSAAQTGEISLATVWIKDSTFNSNALVGLLIESEGSVAFENSRACWNGVANYSGPAPVLGGLGSCPQDEEGGNPPPQWLGVGPQIVNVFFGGGSGPFNLDRTRDLIYKLWEKQPVEAPDNHLLAQVDLPAYVVPLGGSTGFSPLEQSALPGGLPQGMTFVGPAFSFNISDANGNALDALDGKAGISFYLPQGYTVPEGQELVILFFDPESNSWVEIPAQVVDGRVYAYIDKPGTYVLALKPKA